MGLVAIESRQQVVTNLEEFFKIASRKQYKVETKSVTSAETTALAEEIKLEEIFECSAPVTAKTVFSVSGREEVRWKEYSNKLDELEVLLLLCNSYLSSSTSNSESEICK